jgi:hypothetical protein
MRASDNVKFTGIADFVVLGCALRMDKGFSLTAEWTLGEHHGGAGSAGMVRGVSRGGIPGVCADGGRLD